MMSTTTKTYLCNMGKAWHLPLLLTVAGTFACGHKTSQKQAADASAPIAPVTAPAASVAAACPDALGDAALTGKAAVSVTHGTVVTRSAGSLAYTVTAGYLPIYAPGTLSGPVQACMFFFAYTRDDKKVAAATAWPLTFLFNGGPGSPSDWVHLGGLGPKTLNLGSDGLEATSSALSDDQDTLLATSDLVFIDPINTGYSRPAKGVDPNVYNGLSQDAASMGDFIKNYVTSFQRNASPRYLIGESYAGMRIPVLSRYLDEKLNLKLGGIVFISPWLDAMGDDEEDVADDLPYATYLPEFATTAWYQKRLSADMQAKTLDQVYRAAQTFANNTYLGALAQGDDLDAEAAATVAAQLSSFTGIPAATITAANLRLGVDVFRNTVMGGKDQAVSIYDGRKSGTVADPAVDDPYDVYNQIFNDADAQYFGKTLNVSTDLTYATSNWTAWPGSPTGGGIVGGYLNVLPDLEALLKNNPALKVIVASGYYDLTCPPAETEYMLHHLSAAASARVAVHLFASGHPVYFGATNHQQFTADVTALINGTPQPTSVASVTMPPAQ